MKKIGEGWQYSVYDLGNGKVLKKFHSTLRSYWVIFKTIFPFKDDPIWMIPKFSRSMKKTHFDHLKSFKKKIYQWSGWGTHDLSVRLISSKIT